jgi:hypothetical protein
VSGSAHAIPAAARPADSKAHLRRRGISLPGDLRRVPTTTVYSDSGPFVLGYAMKDLVPMARYVSDAAFVARST